MPRWTPFTGYFWSLVDRPNALSCWEWKGGFTRDGYGRVHFAGKRSGAHRVAFQLQYGSIPNRMFVCHSCDNKKCVNPLHLFAGTQKDNMQDWTKKGKNKLINSPLKGEAHWTRNKEKYAAQLKEISERRKREFRSGKRSVVRGEAGRIMGSKIAP